MKEKFIKKAEFLIALQNPLGSYKSEEPEDFLITKKPSYMPRSQSYEEEQKEDWKESMQTWQNNFYDFGKLKNTNEIIAAVKEAGTTSVLAILQSPIQKE